jgi:hypothetical protein
MDIIDIVDYVDEKKSKLNSAEYLELMRLLSILHGSSLLDKKKDQLVDCSDDEGDDNSYNDEYIRDYI